MEPTDNAAQAHLEPNSTLAALVITDIEGFTSKMAINQAHTLELVDRDLQRMREICPQFQGREISDTGDGLFICFASAVKAVECAIEIQKTLCQAAAELPSCDVLKHRIGIDLGDVTFYGSQVKGLGVNIAARLQAVAKPGGICISQTVYEVVKNQIPLTGIYREVRELKGIKEPLLVYQLPPIYSPKKVFISYRNDDPDLTLAQQFYEALTTAGHKAFMAGYSIRLGEGWPQRIEAELQQCDYFLLLLSEQSVTSEMVTEEVRRVKDLRNANPQNKPAILPIRVNFPLLSPLNYNLRGYLDRIQQREWRSTVDTPSILAEILTLVGEGQIPQELPEPLPNLPPAMSGEDDKPLPIAVRELPPMPELPEGQVDLASAFYVERQPIESRCYETILQPGSLIRIKAPRQMGKTSLMARVLHHASQSDCQTVALSFQLADAKIFADLDKFLKWFCANIGRRLRLTNRLNDYWDEIFGSKDNCTAYFEEYLLESIATPLVLGLDEVDCIFEYPKIASDFFGLLRAWHEDAKNRDIWKKLRLVVVHSTEVYIPLSINQSPFNVGLPIELPEFTPQQVYDLTRWHDLDWDIAKVEELMAMVGGHPYLVRLALYHIRRQDITLSKLLATAPTESGLYGDHLRRHLWNLQQYPELAAAIQELVAASRPLKLESLQAFKLHSMGLVHLQGNDCIPRNDLYRLYFRDRLGVK